jgi:hypothetical protein
MDEPVRDWRIHFRGECLAWDGRIISRPQTKHTDSDSSQGKNPQRFGLCLKRERNESFWFQTDGFLQGKRGNARTAVNFE